MIHSRIESILLDHAKTKVSKTNHSAAVCVGESPDKGYLFVSLPNTLQPFSDAVLLHNLSCLFRLVNKPWLWQLPFANPSKVQEDVYESKMYLLSLPNEILLLIIRQLEYADDASALSQTCRLLYSVISPMIVSYYANRDMVKLALRKWDYVLMERILKTRGDSKDLLPYPFEEIILNALRKESLDFFRVMLDHDPSQGNRTYASYFSRATMKGYLDIARLLISRGAIPDADTLEGNTALTEAAGKGSLPAVKFLVEEANCRLDLHDKRGFTPLISAASSGSLDAVKYLLNSGADPTLTNLYEDKTPFAHAAEGLRENVVLFLLKNKQYGDYLRNQTNRELVAKVAASQGNEAIARMLLDQLDLDARPTSANMLNDMFPFLLASAACGFDSIVQKILDKGSKSSPIGDTQRRTLLRKSTYNGHANVVKLLLDFIDDMYPYISGMSRGDVILFASKANQWRILQQTLDRKRGIGIGIYGRMALDTVLHHEKGTRILLEWGADPAINGDHGLEMLQNAVRWERWRSIGVFKMLFERTGLSPLTGGTHWSKFLEMVAEKCDLSIIKAILQTTNYASFHPHNPEYQQALAIATFFNPNKDVIEFFLDNGFDVNLKTSTRLGKGRPLLAIAARRPEFLDPVISLYIDCGGDIELPDEKEQRTPLSWAADGGSYESAKQLLEHGADPLSRDRRGKTVLHRAVIGNWNAGLKAILKTMEVRGVQYDFTDLISALESAPKKKKSLEKRPDLTLKYVRQHQWRMMYPCP